MTSLGQVRAMEMEGKLWEWKVVSIRVVGLCFFARSGKTLPKKKKKEGFFSTAINLCENRAILSALFLIHTCFNFAVG